MLKEFFKNTIENTYIKSLISNTCIPNIDYVIEGDYLFEGFCYIYDGRVIQCIKPGNLTRNQDGETLEDAKWKTVSGYRFGEFILNVTRSYTQSNSYYTEELHKFLGGYLRGLKACYGVNLMSMYNCYCGKYELELTLDEEMVWKNKSLDHNYLNGYELSGNNFYKVYMVPIKFNKTYTIAIDAPTGLLMKPLLRDTHGFLEKVWDEDEKEEIEVGKYDEFDLQSVQFSLFQQPFTFRVNTTNKSLYGMQRYLNLYIQVPKKNNSSLVVLEGDYRSRTSVKISGHPLQEYKGEVISSPIGNAKEADFINQFYNPKLLFVNDSVSYAYDSKLITYLLNNVISNIPQVDENVLRAKKKLEFKGVKPNDYWNTEMKRIVYLYAMERLNYINEDYVPYGMLLEPLDMDDVQTNGDTTQEYKERNSGSAYKLSMVKEEVPSGVEFIFRYKDVVEETHKTIIRKQSLTGQLEPTAERLGKIYTFLIKDPNTSVYCYALYTVEQVGEDKIEWINDYRYRLVEQAKYVWKKIGVKKENQIFMQKTPTNTVYDIIGYVDKETEKFVER